MKPLTQLLALLTLVWGLAGCDNKTASTECFDHPDRFAADLEKDANISVRKGAKEDQVRQYCTQKQLLIVERDSIIYCTAEEYRGLSRCDASVDFELANDRTVKALNVEKPRIKNP
jgi:hypothetical protein